MVLSWHTLIRPEDQSLATLHPFPFLHGRCMQIHGFTADDGSCRRKVSAPKEDVKSAELSRSFRSEITAMEDAYEIRAELPGVAKDDITVSSQAAVFMLANLNTGCIRYNLIK